MAEIIADSRTILPGWVFESLPSDIDGMKDAVAHWLRTHAGALELMGRAVGKAAVHALVGIVIGALLALHEARDSRAPTPLTAAIAERVERFSLAFRRIVFAQVRISLLNTTFTAVYLALVLPALGRHLPLTKTLIGLTFIAGLLPIAGNLISNTVIVVVALSQSTGVALGALLYLVVIHKLEYFLNARIVGSHIAARAWELLLAMLVMEAAFGIQGLVAAPVYYAYVKSELADRRLV
jgi:predicted PurR-regulated permease PerM